MITNCDQVIVQPLNGIIRSNAIHLLTTYYYPITEEEALEVVERPGIWHIINFVTIGVFQILEIDEYDGLYKLTINGTEEIIHPKALIGEVKPGDWIIINRSNLNALLRVVNREDFENEDIKRVPDIPLRPNIEQPEFFKL